ncbi:hypothetical protein ACLOJK_012791 [Asimina triloba]
MASRRLVEIEKEEGVTDYDNDVMLMTEAGSSTLRMENKAESRIAGVGIKSLRLRSKCSSERGEVTEGYTVEVRGMWHPQGVRWIMQKWWIRIEQPVRTIIEMSRFDRGTPVALYFRDLGAACG